MTLTQTILDAIREAPETVEWSALNNVWEPYKPKAVLIPIDEAVHIQWRIKPKPYECRHEIYLDKNPISLDVCNLKFTLLGNADWRAYRNDIYNKRFEIIVRELPE